MAVSINRELFVGVHISYEPSYYLESTTRPLRFSKFVLFCSECGCSKILQTRPALVNREFTNVKEGRHA